MISERENDKLRCETVNADLNYCYLFTQTFLLTYQIYAMGGHRRTWSKKSGRMIVRRKYLADDSISPFCALC